MKKIKLYNDLYAFEFDELHPYLTYVYTIIRNNQLFIIDTFCGSDYMEQIKTYFPNYQYIIINTHFHFDHIWGNSAFKDSSIYAHIKCKEAMIKYGQEDLITFKEFLKGESELLLPNQVFNQEYHFTNESIALFYTPGHSLDSITIIDYIHKVVFAGDNLEIPIIQLEKKNLKVYQETLKWYLDLPFNEFLGGHNLKINKEDIKKMLDYLNRIENNEEIHFDNSEIEAIHLKNLQ